VWVTWDENAGWHQHFSVSLTLGSRCVKALGRVQIIMDVQPLVVLLTGEGHVHGFSHTYVGATVVGIGSALTGKYAAEFGLRLIGQDRYLPIRWPVAMISAFIGSFSRVLLDSVMHADVQPFAPFMLNNPLLGVLSVEALHEFCLYSCLLGVGLYFAVAHWLSRQNPSFKRNTLKRAP
jgi:hypothetical protein